MIRCIIIDDEPFARQEVADLLDHQEIEVLAQCSNAIEALQQINQLKPDLIFLDIQMPRISGMELIAMLNPEHMPRVVFITAFDEFAVKAFDNNAFDYLLKPIDAQRFAQTINKVKQDLKPQVLDVIAPRTLKHLPCYSGNKLKVILTDDVEYIVSEIGGIRVATCNSNHYTQLTLRTLEQKTPLVRCHKQYLVAPTAIAEIELLDSGAQITTHSGALVPVSRRYLKPLKQLLGFQ